ncbi:MAG: class I SAM-dependent methyltransferase [Cardiobacteriaceae bacterium]|nr:class I SAM-dependent methyltransferase [Cardiobacteriaceae bacterium]
MNPFNNANAYERYMGDWSRQAGAAFLQWLAQPAHLSWLDCGCGSGAFTALIWQHMAPSQLHGIDISDELLACARKRLPEAVALQKQSVIDLTFANETFDVATMALVLVFIPEAEHLRGIKEMCRVVRRGGTVATYMWDLPDGFPYATAFTLLREYGVLPQRAAQEDSTSLASLQTLWQAAGLQHIETLAFDINLHYQDFDTYWQTLQGSASMGEQLAALSSDRRTEIRKELETRLSLTNDGNIDVSARAHAVKGIRP